MRAESRQQELAIRAALGAGSGRIVRELLIGKRDARHAWAGVVGLGARVRRACGCWSRSRRATCRGCEDITIDLPVLLFALALSLLSGLLFGRDPGAQARGRAARDDAAWRADGTASASKDRQRARNVLVVAQVALALVLLVSSGLDDPDVPGASRSVHPGFVRPGDVQTLRLSIPEIAGEGRRGGRPDASGHPGEAGGACPG